MTQVFGPILDPGAPIDKQQLADALDNRLIITFTDANAVQSWTAGTPNGTQAVFVTGLGIYSRDDADTTSPHDGVTVLVSADGVRFKNDIMLKSVRVLRADLDTPPTSPTIGDGYLLIPAPTGDWAGHQDEIAVWTSLGWLYVPPTIGLVVYVENLDSFYRYTSSAQWKLGLGTSAVSERSIDFRSLQYPAGLIVLNTLSTPPSFPVDGDLYIVGIDPTGAWTGQQNNLALWEGEAWTFVVSETGWTVWCLASACYLYFNGSGWTQALRTASIARKRQVFTIGAGIAPMTSLEGVEVGVMTYAADSANNQIRATGTLQITASIGEQIMGVFIDEETEAAFTIRPGSIELGVFTFDALLTPGDTAEHVYKVRTTGSALRLEMELTEVPPSS